MTLVRLGLELFLAYEKDLDEGRKIVEASNVRLTAYALETVIRLQQKNFEGEPSDTHSQYSEILDAVIQLRAEATEFEKLLSDQEKVRLSLRLLNNLVAYHVEHGPYSPTVCPIYDAETLRIARAILTRLHHERGLSAPVNLKAKCSPV